MQERKRFFDVNETAFAALKRLLQAQKISIDSTQGEIDHSWVILESSHCFDYMVYNDWLLFLTLIKKPWYKPEFLVWLQIETALNLARSEAST